MVKYKVKALRVLAAVCVAVFMAPHTLWALDETDDSIGQRHELKEFILEKRRRFDPGGVQMGAVRLMGDEVKAMPTVFGEPDVLKTLQATPGVQRGKNGNAGIMVRGGGYDQNTMMVDGAVLYSSEHMRGFVTAVNPDIVDNLSFYRGAFPVQYAGRLSSVIDIEGKQGDFQRWHAEASAGVSMARVNAGGPIVRGKTSIEVAARMSYFGLIFRPIVGKHYEKLNMASPYSHLDFWDINTKLAQYLGQRDLLTLSVTVDEDRQDFPAREPSRFTTKLPFYVSRISNREVATSKNKDELGKEELWDLCGTQNTTNLTEHDPESIHWGNQIASVNWRHNFGGKLRQLLTTVAYTSYRYRSKRGVYQSDYSKVDFSDNYWRPDSVISDCRDRAKLTQHSDIRNLRIASVMSYRLNNHHALTYGLEGRLVNFDPRRQISRNIYDYKNWCTRDAFGNIYIDHRDELNITDIDTLISRKQTGKTFSAFAGDELQYGHFKASLGANFTAYIVRNKAYTSLEPRVSLCFDVTNNTYLKTSFSRMSQGERVLSSASVRTPGDFWVMVTDSVPPMYASQYALSVNQRLPLGIEMSLEGYYKRATGTLEYLEGVNYSDVTSSWQDQITIGRSRSWGVEFMAQRDAAPLTGWVSYTFSSAEEQYDTPGRAINNGEWFAAAADRPHNLQVFLQYSRPIKRYPGNSWDFAVHFNYMSGRKLTFPDHITYAGMLEMADHYSNDQGFSSWTDTHLTLPTIDNGTVMLPEEGFDQFMRFQGYSERFNYTLPAESSLDITMSINIKHPVGKSKLTVGVTNLLNKKNLTNLYLYTDTLGKTWLKGVCDFPIMPVFAYTYSF